MAFDWKKPIREGAMRDARLLPEAAAEMFERLGCAPEIAPKVPEPPKPEPPKPETPKPAQPEPLPKKPAPPKLDVKCEPPKPTTPQYGPVMTAAYALKDALFGKRKR